MIFIIGLLCQILSVTTGVDVPCAARFGDSGYVCVCNATYCDTLNYPSPPAGQFTHIFTSNHTPGFNSAQGPVGYHQNVLTDEQYTTAIITVNTTEKFQKLKGIGGSFTDSFCLNMKNLSEAAGRNLLSSYFSSTGIEYKLGRVPIASSDFSTRTYTYDDTVGDTALKYFNLTEEDFLLKIPTIEAAKALSRHNLSLIGATWTSPSWTKTNKNFPPGYLQKEYYQYWAQYLIRFLDEYSKVGIDFWAVSAGNEPINPFIIGKMFDINSVLWMPMDHRKFVKDHLGPLLQASPHNTTKLITLDDARWYLLWWMDTVMRDPEVADYIDGVALHWYRDTQCPPDLLDQVFRQYNKFIIYTEACIIPRLDPGLTVDLGSWRRAEIYITDIIEVLNHWSVGFMDWNMALNTQGGPRYPPHGGTDSPIIVNASADEFYKNPMFYGLGHFSKFIAEGSYRVNSTSTLPAIKVLTTINPDGSTSVFLYNQGENNTNILINDINKRTAIRVNITARSMNTVVWW
ncbi:lysosomal acid glucosylceramidase-like isoform X2 [Homalodisca vitripennis]|uniref:lysosomal acid glucosylceramidase-like isoform X2 n=1 Tax=Homalodisca vitripennis TaxID=197043 RepID=UPI001EEA1339|nr:lysosomal acid glucosylceramidase-like isoform X2 [Homalodisca vitripennis]